MIDVIGGVYLERCMAPHWDQLYGSGGRAAHALSGLNNAVRLHAPVDAQNRAQLKAMTASFGSELHEIGIDKTHGFHYVHPLSVPIIHPPPPAVRNKIFKVTGDVLLRFGMLEADAHVTGKRVVYDPQSAYDPRPFRENGSTAEQLAIVANGYELRLVTGIDDVLTAARAILQSDGADVVIAKQGSRGALVITAATSTHVPAYRSAAVFSIGSGDIFAAAFTHYWAVEGVNPEEAADLASRSTARYCETRDAQLVSAAEVRRGWNTCITVRDGKIYLAGPFFNTSERWLVEEARIHLGHMGVPTFSPLHDVGHGAAEYIAAKDLEGLDACNRMLALVDTRDPGTVFEIGYARAKQIPVVLLAETLNEKELKMLVGAGCTRTDDFATALYFAAWS
jgi:Nucleoside 2-deoxyribosyltransferase/pfkB family carbohydrate kinase